MANVKFQRAKLFIFTNTVDPKSQSCNGNLTISHPNNKTRVSISLVDPTKWGKWLDNTCFPSHRALYKPQKIYRSTLNVSRSVLVKFILLLKF